MMIHNILKCLLTEYVNMENETHTFVQLTFCAGTKNRARKSKPKVLDVAIFCARVFQTEMEEKHAFTH